MTQPGYLSAAQAVELLRQQHAPVMHAPSEVSECGEDLRAATLDEQAEGLKMWCEGCHRLASRCRVMPVLGLVAVASD